MQGILEANSVGMTKLTTFSTAAVFPHVPAEDLGREGVVIVVLGEVVDERADRRLDVRLVRVGPRVLTHVAVRRRAPGGTVTNMPAS